MTINLSSKRQALIRLMKQSPEHERQGFELLVKRSDFAAFFDALDGEGLFDPQRNLRPVEVDKPGQYRVPYWPPLAYLEAAAKLAGQGPDCALATRVMQVIRRVSRWRDNDGLSRDNPTTFYVFAQMLALLPTSAVSATDIDMIPTWLAGEFGGSHVGQALVTGALRKLLASAQSDDWAKACRVLAHCTVLQFTQEQPETRAAPKEPRTLVDDYWLKEAIRATSPIFGKKIGKDAADVFLTRLKELYERAFRGADTWLHRPAVEDHPQNYDWRGPYNYFVEGLRDTATAWLDSTPGIARPYIEELFASRFEIVERIAIHLVNERFDLLRTLVPRAILPAFFHSGHRHELYLLLNAHFRDFTSQEQAATLAAIRDLPLPDRGEDSERIRRIIQQNWLSAIAGQGHEQADAWLEELKTAEPAGLRPHPEFFSYHEMHYGFGPTPYNPQDLMAFAEQGALVEQLNAFVPSGDWGGPSKWSLSDAVIEAVGLAPQTFIAQLSMFLNANPEYQYAIIAGFKKLWDGWDGKQPGLPWSEFWPKLIDFFETLLSGDQVWEAEAPERFLRSPTHDWIPPAISEFLRAGSRSDEKAFAPDLLPRSLKVIRILLTRSDKQKEPRPEDALTAAINSGRGKALEALIEHALRRCRLSDQAGTPRADAWRELQVIFDAELDACRDDNFEFSALAGVYIGNLYYMSEPWVHDNFKRIFPTEFPANCLSALDGLAYSRPLQPIYQQLVKSGVLDWALRHEAVGTQAREALLQRVGLAYLFNNEELDGPRFAILFDARGVADLQQIGRYFWMVRGESLKDEQKDRIFVFCEKCVSWSRSLDSAPAELLSTLSLLSCYLTTIDERALSWLLTVAPHAQVSYRADQLIDELLRLAESSPTETGKVLRALLDAYRPAYDFKDKLKKLIALLAGHAESRRDAILSLEQIRYLPGMVELYAHVSSTSAAGAAG